MSKFVPAPGYCEVEKLTDTSPLASDERTYEEKAKVIQVSGYGAGAPELGDIIFFRPHGFFETAEHDGVKHYVVRVDPEFILGVLKADVESK